jgi:hypothetical protein
MGDQQYHSGINGSPTHFNQSLLHHLLAALTHAMSLAQLSTVQQKEGSVCL